jgi:hypothetical protein
MVVQMIQGEDPADYENRPNGAVPEDFGGCASMAR